MVDFNELPDEQKWNMARTDFDNLKQKVNSLATIVTQLQKDFEDFKKKQNS